jgi:hypothetical protein
MDNPETITTEQDHFHMSPHSKRAAVVVAVIILAIAGVALYFLFKSENKGFEITSSEDIEKFSMELQKAGYIKNIPMSQQEFEQITDPIMLAELMPSKNPPLTQEEIEKLQGAFATNQ